MTATALFATLKSLPREDKIKVIRFLVADLEAEEPALQSSATYSLWSPLNSHEAARKLAQLLESEQLAQDAAENRMSESKKTTRPTFADFKKEALENSEVRRKYEALSTDLALKKKLEDYTAESK